MLDFYAIRAQQHAWFVEFVKNWDPKKNLAQLPNIAYSLALATFYSGNSAGKNNSTENTNLEADEKLQRALIDFPRVSDFPGKYVCTLFVTCQQPILNSESTNFTHLF